MKGAALLDPISATEPEPARTLPRWRALYWLGVPLLAALAYVTILRLGFVSDDLVLLYQAEQSGIDFGVFRPQPNWFLYRPLGAMLVWQVGWQLWGFNPLAFHLVGLLLHCAVATVTALWVAAVTSRAAVGWLAGALFGVFPLHLEAVGWVAAQWDVLGALFGLCSLLCFTLWWKRDDRERGWGLYAAALALFAAAIFTKESLLTIIALFPLAAWLADRAAGRSTLRRLALALVPFVLVLSFNAGLRLLSWGHLGGYGRNRLDWSGLPPVLWDQLIAHTRLLVSPLNSTMFGATVVLVVGVALMALLLLGLARYGRSAYRGLALGAGCLVVFLVPVLILPIGTTDLQNNRFSYLPGVGYCVIVATLLYAATNDLLRSRPARVFAIALPILAALAVTWVQLGPWYVAGVQARDVDDMLLRLMPLEARDHAVEWYVQNPPDNYHGAYVHRLGIGTSRYFQGGSRPDVRPVADARAAPLASVEGDAFALSFAYDPQAERFNVDYGAGITAPSRTEPNSGGEMRWDFRDCSPVALDAWQVVGARSRCVRGEGIKLEPSGNDPQLVAPDIGVRVPRSGGHYLRLRVAMSAEQGPAPGAVLAQWFWFSPGGGWTVADSGAVPLRPGGDEYVYWLFRHFGEGEQGVSGLRFDPVNGEAGAVTIGWMEAAEVP